MAIAEGQTTAPDWVDAKPIAGDSLSRARTVASQNLSFLPLDVQTLDRVISASGDRFTNESDAHDVVSNLRQSYRDVILRSSLP